MNKEVMAALLLGSNLGNRTAYLNRAISMIQREVGKVDSVSSIYETEPWGMTSTLSFYNQAVTVITTLPPGKLVLTCIKIEKALGRKRGKTTGDRKIDIDVLLYGGKVVDQKKCTIPHPRLHLRKFALIPLAEIGPDLEHPLLKMSISELERLCTDPLEVKKVEGISIQA
jgi:2-amino-4-hydroxy-6-hydroxymethyldihydropteridine diphosphokinase